MPTRGRLGSAGEEQMDLPEFFRDSLAPPFLDHVLEDSMEIRDCQGKHRKGHARINGILHSPLTALSLSVDDDGDDEIVFRAQLLQ